MKAKKKGGVQKLDHSFSFIHAADLHLDTPFTGMGSLPKNLREKVLHSTFVAYENVIQLCIDRNVNFLLLAGDIYDSSDRSLRAQIYFKEGLEKLAHHGIQVYMVHGNHDPLDQEKLSLSLPNNTYVFPPGQVAAFRYERGGKELARIYGVSYPRRQVRESYLPAFKRDEGDFFSIGLLHTNVDGHPAHDNYAPVSRAELIHQGFDYWALGHIHQKNILHHGEPVILYPGNIQGLNIKETNERGCYFVAVQDQKVAELTFCITDCLRWYHEKVNLSECEQVQELLDLLERKKEEVRIQVGGRGAIVSFHLTGRTSLHSFVHDEKNLADIQEMLRRHEEEREDFVWIDSLEMSTKPMIQLEQIAEEETLLGDFYQLSLDYRNMDNVHKLRKEVLTPLLDHYFLRGYFRDLSDEEILEWLEDAETLGLDFLLSGGDGK